MSPDVSVRTVSSAFCPDLPRTPTSQAFHRINCRFSTDKLRPSSFKPWGFSGSDQSASMAQTIKYMPESIFVLWMFFNRRLWFLSRIKCSIYTSHCILSVSPSLLLGQNVPGRLFVKLLEHMSNIWSFESLLVCYCGNFFIASVAFPFSGLPVVGPKVQKHPKICFHVNWTLVPFVCWTKLNSLCQTQQAAHIMGGKGTRDTTDTQWREYR